MELIVVITILVILGTIAFISLGGYSSKARDSGRVSDLTNLTKSLELTRIKTGYYPSPSSFSGVFFSGGLAWNQGTIGDSVMQNVGAAGIGFSKKPTDPQFPSVEYTYSLLQSGKEYQIATVMENSLAETSGIPFITQTYAATDPVTTYVQGNYNGLITKVQTGSVIYFLALPSIILHSVSGSTLTELTNTGVQATNLVLNKL